MPNVLPSERVSRQLDMLELHIFNIPLNVYMYEIFLFPFYTCLGAMDSSRHDYGRSARKVVGKIVNH